MNLVKMQILIHQFGQAGARVSAFLTGSRVMWRLRLPGPYSELQEAAESMPPHLGGGEEMVKGKL